MNQICKTCQVEKDFDKDFYVAVCASGRDSTCKECRKLQSRQRKLANKGKPKKHNIHEQAFIEACHEHGVYAVQATDTRHKFCDVVAWGCVRIEVKHPDTVDDNHYSWRFTVNQARKRLPADIIVLVTEHLGETKYHFFNPLHPIFFNPDQTRKIGLSYVVERERDYHTQYGALITPDILNMHRDAWQTIENTRLEKSKQLRQQTVGKKRKAA